MISAKLKRRGPAVLFVLLGGCGDVVSPAPVVSPTPNVTAVVLAPASASLQTGGTQRFATTAQLSDGTNTDAIVTYQTTAGSIANDGVFTAGQTAGTFRVIARQSGGTLADTAVVSVTAPTPPPPPPPPPPTSGNTYFSATAEAGTISPWDAAISDGASPRPSASQASARSGGWSYKYEVPNPVGSAYAQTHAYRPQTSMGGPSGHFTSGYYSFWAYVDAGYTSPDWNALLGWMTAVGNTPSPISYIGLEVWDGTLQVVYSLTNCVPGHYVCPTIPNYRRDSGWYTMTTSSPAGIKAFPRKQWVHLSVYYKMAFTGGQVKIWQDGTLIMDLTAPTMNTMGGHSYTPLTNTAGDMILQFGIYGGAKSDGAQRLYIDDFKVTDYRIVP